MSDNEFNPLSILNAPSTSDAAPSTTTRAESAGPTHDPEPAPDTENTSTDPVPARRPSRWVYRRRQATWALTSVAVVAGIVALSITGIPGAAPSPAEQAAAVDAPARNATRVAGLAEARADQDAAARHYRLTGTYVGFTRPGALSAGNAHTWVASRSTDETCLLYAMRGTHRTRIGSDSSGVACTSAEIDATAQALNDADDAAAAADAADARAAFDHLARTVAGYRTTTYTGGRASLHGFPTRELIAGIHVVANTGDQLTAQYRSDTGCTQVTVNLDGRQGTPTSC